MIEKHPFEPFVPKDCEILVLGSFPGKESTQNTREDDWFYGAKRNQFWKILELVYNKELKSVTQKQNLFSELKIGITDIIDACERKENSNKDGNLINIKYNERIDSILNKNSISKILFTSKGVYQDFIKNYNFTINIDLIILPSPSPIYRRMSFENKVVAYQKNFPVL